VNGILILPENAQVALPGDTLKCKAKLDVPIPLSEGNGFVIRENGKTVGCGKIEKITTNSIEEPEIPQTAAARRRANK